nr:hypothetical protein RclHR1_06060014 [Ipomoea batatas]
MNQSYGFTSKSSGLSAGSARIDSKRRDVTKAGPKRGIADGISVRRRRPPSVELRRVRGCLNRDLAALFRRTYVGHRLFATCLSRRRKRGKVETGVTTYSPAAPHCRRATCFVDVVAAYRRRCTVETICEKGRDTVPLTKINRHLTLVAGAKPKDWFEDHNWHLTPVVGVKPKDGFEDRNGHLTPVVGVKPKYRFEDCNGHLAPVVGAKPKDRFEDHNGYLAPVVGAKHKDQFEDHNAHLTHVVGVKPKDQFEDRNGHLTPVVGAKPKDRFEDRNGHHAPVVGAKPKDRFENRDRHLAPVLGTKPKDQSEDHNGHLAPVAGTLLP